jgi:hypothetical protein
MKTFVIDTVLPGLTEFEDVLITREESKIYREIDKVLGQAMIETLETQEEVQGYEMVDVKEVVRTKTGPKQEEKTHKGHTHHSHPAQVEQFDQIRPSDSGMSRDYESGFAAEGRAPYSSDVAVESGEIVEIFDEAQADGTIVRTRKVRRPILKKTFALRRIGYKVIPYEDETDSRYSFTTENMVFVNKANPTYRAEATRGDEFLLRHVISIVADAVAQSKHPEGKDALELQTRLVAEAIRIHDHSAKR